MWQAAPLRIAGKRMYLWRAVDHEGEVLDSTPPRLAIDAADLPSRGGSQWSDAVAAA
jgi:hypothetical protein